MLYNFFGQDFRSLQKDAGQHMGLNEKVDFRGGKPNSAHDFRTENAAEDGGIKRLYLGEGKNELRAISGRRSILAHLGGPLHN